MRLTRPAMVGGLVRSSFSIRLRISTFCNTSLGSTRRNVSVIGTRFRQIRIGVSCLCSPPVLINLYQDCPSPYLRCSCLQKFCSVYQSITEPSSGSKRVLYSAGSPTCARSLSSSMVMPKPGSVGNSRWPFFTGGRGFASRLVCSASPRS